MEKSILKICMEKGFLLDKEMLEIFSEFEEESAKEIIEKISDLNIGERVITKNLFSKNLSRIGSVLVDGKARTVIEKFFVNVGYSKEVVDEGVEQGAVETADVNGRGRVKIISAPFIEARKVTVKDFVTHFRSRYDFMRKVLEGRGLENLTSLRKISGRGNYTIIVSVVEKRVTKNKNLIMTVEDLTGNSVVLVNQNRKEVFEIARELLLDDIVAMEVSGSDEMLFVNNIFFPDSVLQEKRRGAEDEWVAFTSDLHVGSEMFLEDNFLKFIKWLNGEWGDEKQREMAKKVKYLFFTGDNVDGVGVYPSQEKLLKIKEAKEQYVKMVELLKLIRDDLKIIICPGQHDAVWVGEPQPIIDDYWAPGLHKMDNVTLVPNPSLVEIDSGFNILMYHGASMHSFVENIPDIRLNYGHDSPARVVKELLKRRHLAPMHGSVDYVPADEDLMMIKRLPDIVATADWHRPEVSTYNNILLVASACWQSITPFEEKVGNHPDPCKVPLFNLKTREIKILDFSDGDNEECREEGEEVSCEVKNG